MLFGVAVLLLACLHINIPLKSFRICQKLPADAVGNDDESMSGSDLNTSVNELMADIYNHLLTLCILNENEIIIAINGFLLSLTFNHSRLSLIHAHTKMCYSYLNSGFIL